MLADEAQDQTTNGLEEGIRQRLVDDLVPLALHGLGRMLSPDGASFCHEARPGQGGQLQLVGRSNRYSAMTLIGLAMQDRLGRTTGIPTDKVYDRLVDWVEQDAQSGDAGLVLWALALKKDPRAERVAKIIAVGEEEHTGRPFARDSMSLGWLLTGLSVAIREGIGGGRLPAVAEGVYELLLRNRNQTTGLFSLAGPEFRKNLLKWRMNARLGGFASQVYPTIGLSYYAMASGSEQPLRLAEQTADALCRLQGPEGQWWWIYDTKTAEPAIRYPVYSIHQDAMGPMALLAVSLATEGRKDYSLAIRKSLDWLDRHPECPGQKLIDRDAGVVWRAIQRDEPARTGAFGLGPTERVRMNLAAWTGLSDRRAFKGGYVCDECRPYQLGWILVAAAMFSAWEESFR